MATFTVPGLSDGCCSTSRQHHWFLVSDLAGMLGGLVTDVSSLTLHRRRCCSSATCYVLWRTAFGLRLRSCGENPVAAESLGVNVYRYKYVAVIVSGASRRARRRLPRHRRSHIYLEGQTGGRGYIGLAAMIFGNWRPGGLAVGAGLFGYTDALQLRGGGDAVHALLLLLVAAAARPSAVWLRAPAAVRPAVVSAGLRGAAGRLVRPRTDRCRTRSSA